MMLNHHINHHVSIISIGASVSSMVYSNSGAQLSAGLCSGDVDVVDVIESDSGRLFTLGRPLAHSEVTTHTLYVE